MIDFPKKTLREVAPRRQAVLLRADYNVPLNPDGAITDDFRLTASLPTLKYLIARKNRVVICAHLGRPGGEVNLKFSLEPVAKRMSELLGQDVKFAPDCIGDAAVVAAKKLAPGEVLLLENLRFHPGEKSNDPNFAKELVKASGARLFVQDGFGVVHRAAASTVAITGFLPSVAGLLVEKEYLAIKSATDDPARPLVAVLGGAKISDKIQLIQRFISIADGGVVIGGAMANNFLKFMKYDVGQSLVEDGLDDVA
ncbi:MAG: phosphoglycerate kinase, partial [Candidatus Nomurabacteria bacterium]|nr:phosphoglycerate kinase [Candidatus Nomurabacteria bacterium]